MSAEQHLTAAAEFIAIAEAADSSSVAYRRAAEEIQAAIDEDPALTQVEVGRRIGKGEMYVGRLLKALSRAMDGEDFQVDWGSGSNKRAAVMAKTAVERPREFAKAFEKAPPKAQRQIVQEILKTPGTGSRLIEQEVQVRAAQDREKAHERNERRDTHRALPLNAYMARMLLKIDEMARGMHDLRDELDTLPAGENRDRVVDATRRLINEATWWLNHLEGHDRGVERFEVIEGQAS